MAIKKKLIHVNSFENFNSMKLSANVNNTQYTLGVNGTVTTGSPDILYQSVVWIKDTKQQWTHGQLYDFNSGDDYTLWFPESEDATYVPSASNYPASDWTTDVERDSHDGDLFYNPYSSKYWRYELGTWVEITDTMSANMVLYTSQTKTAAEKMFARGNIDAAYVTGDVFKYFNVMTPALDTHAANKKYVDDAVANISSSGGSSSGGGAYAEVSHGTSDTTFSLTPNTFHVWDEVASLDLELGAETSGVANEYLFQFTSGATPTTLTLPDDIKWANDTAPTIAENMIYQVSVLKGLGSVLEFSNKASVFPAILGYGGDNGDVGVKVYEELYAIAGSGSGTLNENDLVFNFNGRNVNVTNFFYISTPYAGYVIHDTGMEYYILTSTGNITYYYYD